MWWIASYLALVINLIIICLMPKRLTKKEIYVTWFVIALINLSTDVLLCLDFRLYELAEPGVQLSVHVLELTLGPSYGIIYLNFMPEQNRKFYPYIAAWVAYAVIFEFIMVQVDFVNYSGWKLWYSAIYYVFAYLFLRWHLYYIRK
jgi:hypothetical protein